MTIEQHETLQLHIRHVKWQLEQAKNYAPSSRHDQMCFDLAVQDLKKQLKDLTILSARTDGLYASDDIARRYTVLTK